MYSTRLCLYKAKSKNNEYLYTWKWKEKRINWIKKIFTNQLRFLTNVCYLHFHGQNMYNNVYLYFTSEITVDIRWSKLVTLLVVDTARRVLSTEDILAVLTQNVSDLHSLTAKFIQDSLESKLGVNLSGHEKKIEQVLNAVKKEEDTQEIVPPNQPAPSTDSTLRGRKCKAYKNNFPFSKSDDEGDCDFNPRVSKKPSRNVRKKKE